MSDWHETSPNVFLGANKNVLGDPIARKLLFISHIFARFFMLSLLGSVSKTLKISKIIFCGSVGKILGHAHPVRRGRGSVS